MTRDRLLRDEDGDAAEGEAAVVAVEAVADEATDAVVAADDDATRRLHRSGLPPFVRPSEKRTRPKRL